MAIKPCPRCGKMISDKAERCPKCGLDVKNFSSAKSSQDQKNIRRPKLEQPKKSKTGLWICLGILLAVGIGAAIWIPVHRHNEKVKVEKLALLVQQRRDSIAAVKAELARLEQLRQDSIQLVMEEEENSLKITTFCKWDNEEKVMTHRDGKRIFSNLEKLGFTLIDKSVRHDNNDFIGTVDLETRVYSREKYGSNLIVQVSNIDKREPSNSCFSNVIITFPNSDLKEKFLKTASSNKFKRKSDKYYEGPNATQCYWTGTDIKIKDNIVELIERFEP